MNISDDSHKRKDKGIWKTSRKRRWLQDRKRELSTLKEGTTNQKNFFVSIKIGTKLEILKLVITTDRCYKSFYRTVI